MTRRLFVCHATADIEAASELVDALENALSFSPGSVWTSSLPGYCADANDMPALGAALAGSDIVLALVTQTSVHDAQFQFELGAAWALGAHTVLFLLDASAQAALPSALSQASVMRGHAPSQWPELIGDLSVRLGLVPRPRASSPPALRPASSPPAHKSAPPPPAAAAPAPAADETTPASPVQAAPATAEPQTFPEQATPADATREPTPAQAATAASYTDAAPKHAANESHDHAAQAHPASAARDHAAPTHPESAARDHAAQTHAANASPDHPSPVHAASASLDQVAPTHAASASLDHVAPAHATSAALDHAAPSHAASAALDHAAPTHTASATLDHAAQTHAASAALDHAAQTHATSAALDHTAPPHATREPPPIHAAAASASPAAGSAKRADETPLPAAVAKIANASARPPGAASASAAASQKASYPTSQLSAAAPSKPNSVPPLPGARPPGPANLSQSPAAPRAVGVPPLPAAVTSSAVIVPPPPLAEPITDNSDANEPTTTPKAPIVILSTTPQPEQNPSAPTASQVHAGPDPQPHPTAADSYAQTHSYLDELRAIGDPEPAERTHPKYSYIDELEPLDPEDVAAALDNYEALPTGDDDEEPETREQLRVSPRDPAAGAVVPAAAEVERVSDSDVFARLPTCEMALEAGRAVSDCLFNRDEIDNFAAELDEPLGSLIESLGASWIELRVDQDLDTWVAVTDHLLETLPEQLRKLEEWYRVGFELATLHNLAGQLVLDGSDAAAEQHWRGALERFLMRAERAEIGYENLGRVLGLLENLVGPSHERDLSNIPRSLEELRRYAAGADIHTAA